MLSGAGRLACGHAWIEGALGRVGFLCQAPRHAGGLQAALRSMPMHWGPCPCLLVACHCHCYFLWPCRHVGRTVTQVLCIRHNLPCTGVGPPFGACRRGLAAEGADHAKRAHALVMSGVLYHLPPAALMCGARLASTLEQAAALA